MPTLGSLFAGIGGIDLGFERAGFTTVWQVEKNAYCRKVLRKNFPHADRRVTDVRFAGAKNLKPVDVIAGGFPCQDISNAGKRAGIDGERSGLWSHYARIIGELRPQIVFIENVAALLGRGMVRVLCDLTEIGYDAEWQVISAADVGAPHLRERIWIVAYPAGEQSNWIFQRGIRRDNRTGIEESISSDDGGKRIQGIVQETLPQFAAFSWCKDVRRIENLRELTYLPKPLIRRNSNGFSSGMDRLRALGNAVVPQIPELIARRIAEFL